MEVLNIRAVFIVLVLVIQNVQSFGLFSLVTRGSDDNEEVPSTVIDKLDGYQIREYNSKNCVCTDQDGNYNSIREQIAVFSRLFDYIDGENSENTKVGMDVPVSILYNNSNGEKQVTACFYLDKYSQENYPEPTNPLLRIEMRPAMTIFSWKFGGYATSERDWLREAEKLKQALDRNGENFQPNLMFWNAYDSPRKLWWRKNEIWIVKKQ